MRTWADIEKELRMRKRILLLFGLPAMLLPSFVGCSHGSTVPVARPGESFAIGVGQSTRIAGEEMTITFNEVTGDSRAPQNVNTIWEGVASIHITIVYQGADYPVMLQQYGSTEQAADTFMDYTLTHSLDPPYPVAGTEIEPRYRLTLTVTHGAPIVDNRATVRGQVIKTTRLASGGWQVDLQLEQINGVSNLPNPISDRLGQVVNVLADEDAGNLKVGEVITAAVKLTGDPDRHVYLYMYDIAK